MTTAIYPNRIAEKELVERIKGLPEDGNSTTIFKTRRGTVFARGYVRVVYGDHGPYVEFDPSHIVIGLNRKFPHAPPARAFYEWLVPADGSTFKVYRQLKEVKHLKNPPAGGFRGNRSEGYADYRIGAMYVSPWDLQIEYANDMNNGPQMDTNKGGL